MLTIIRYAVGSLVFIFVSVAIAVSHAANIASHRAFYEMRMGQADKNAVVQSVTGRSAFILDSYRHRFLQAFQRQLRPPQGGRMPQGGRQRSCRSGQAPRRPGGAGRRLAG